MGRTFTILLLASLLLSAPLTGLVGCDRVERGDPQLTEREFADLFLEVGRLEHLFAEQPDSLARRRDALYRSRGITQAEIERFIQQREHRPEAWEGVFRHLEHRLEEQVDTLPEPPLGAARYRPSVLDSLRAAASTPDTSALGTPAKYRVPPADTAAGGG
jgi:hypothetical protein